MNLNGKNVSPRLDGIGEYYFSKKLREIAGMKFNGEKIINLGIGSPDMDPPESVIRCLSKSARISGSHMYQSYKGIPDLRNAFADWYLKYFNVVLDPEVNILPLIGSKEGIMHVSMTFIHDGDEVLVPNPGYPAYTAATKLAGGTPVEYILEPQNNWLPDFNILGKRDLSRVKVMWVNYPHMPTGAKANDSQLRELISFGRDNHILLINDNPYSFILNDKPKSLLENSKINEDSILELNSLSKSHNMAGWRVGVVAGNSKLLNYILRFKSNMDSGMFWPIMMASVKALKEGREWYENLNEVYRKRRQLAWKVLDLIGCKYRKDQSGMFVWAEIPSEWENGEDFADWILNSTGIFITPGFIFGSQGNRYVRISLCNDFPVWEQVIKQIKENYKSKILIKE